MVQILDFDLLYHVSPLKLQKQQLQGLRKLLEK